MSVSKEPTALRVRARLPRRRRQFLHSSQFRDLACHPDAGNAFVRRRKLPLPALVAVMLSGMRKSVQTELDEFFAHVKQQAQLVHHGNAGSACVRDFLRSGEDDRIVTLAAADRRDAADYECPATAQTVRLIRHVSGTGKVRVLMTNLIDPLAFPLREFGDLYHQRWSIEEAFKRLKHRLNLEHVSGLSQQAAMHDFAANVVCDNLQSLATQAALREAPLPSTRRINRAAAHSILKPLLPALLLGVDIGTRLLQALHLIAGRTYSHRPDIVKSKPRIMRTKPHKAMTQKPC